MPFMTKINIAAIVCVLLFPLTCSFILIYGLFYVVRLFLLDIVGPDGK